MGHHEGRQGLVFVRADRVTSSANALTEFSGTLLGFDDYVSTYLSRRQHDGHVLMIAADMVLEDVTEL